MKHTLKNLVTLVIIMSILMTIVVIPASAANMTGGEVIYLIPNSNWKQSGARFAVYFFGNGSEAWVDMANVSGDLYVAVAPSGTWTNYIFCRMNPNAKANNWNNKWNQSGDLTYNSSKNCGKINAGHWDCGTNITWSKVTSTFTASGALESGDAGFFGTAWDVANTANDLTSQSDGTYKIVYKNVPAGKYKFKIAIDHSWSLAWPASDYAFTVNHSNSTVTITFNPKTQAVGVTVDCEHTNTEEVQVSAPTCASQGLANIVCSACEAKVGEKTLPTIAHNYKNGVCSGCGDVRMVTIGDSNFASIDDAIAAAGDNDVITLQADINYDNVLYLMNNAKIDLNGHTLTALGVSVFSDGGSIFDSSETKGLLAVPNGYLIMNGSENDMLPIWNEDGTGYLFVEVEAKNMMSAIDEDSFKIVFRPEFDSVNAADFFADGAPDNGITLSVQIKCIRDEQVVETLGFTAPESTIQSIYTNNKAMSLTVNGAGTNFDSYEIAILLTSDTGVVFSQVIGSFSQGIYTPVA